MPRYAKSPSLSQPRKLMAHIPEPVETAATGPPEALSPTSQGLEEGEAAVPEAQPQAEEEVRAPESLEESPEESPEEPVAEADADPSPRALGSESRGSFMPTAPQPEHGYASDMSKLPVSNTGYSYPQFVERFKDQSGI